MDFILNLEKLIQTVHIVKVNHRSIFYFLFCLENEVDWILRTQWLKYMEKKIKINPVVTNIRLTICRKDVVLAEI